MIELDTGPDIRSDLLWDDGKFILRNSMPVLNDENKFIGRIITEEPLPALTRIFTEITLIGKKGDFLLFAPRKGNNLELDCFSRGFEVIYFLFDLQFFSFN